MNLRVYNKMQKEGWINLQKFRMWLQRVMFGRYGIDETFYGLFVLYFLLSILEAVTDFFLLYILMLLVMGYMFFRVFSKNIYARSRENERFKVFWGKIKKAFTPKKPDPYFVFRRCPSCKTNLRLPRRVGTHTAVCPRCKREFKVKVR